MEHIRYLVDVIGYRPPTSEGERWASKYIAGVLEKLGIEHQLETFQSYRTFSYPYMIIFAVSLLGSLLACRHGFLGFVVSACGAVAFYLENTTGHFVSRILSHDPSQNVVGKILPRGEAKRVVALVAHYDTSRTGLSFHPRFVQGFRTSTIITMVSIFGIPVAIILGGLFWSGLFRLFRCLAEVWLVVSILILIHREVYGKNVYGANDNASGVGVVVSLAELFSKEPLQRTELWIVATGCQEAGLVGMCAFLDSHGLELKDAMILNFDNLGTGQLKYITSEGMFKTSPSDPELLLLSAEVVRENPDLKLLPHEYHALPTDGYAALVRGYRALSIMAFDEEGVIPNWHWETDLIENLEEKNLEQAERFASLLLKKIDEK
jgi:hypothetical protein